VGGGGGEGDELDEGLGSNLADSGEEDEAEEEEEDSACADLLENCGSLAPLGCDESYVAQNCQLSCNLCPVRGANEYEDANEEEEEEDEEK
jgi:hypothetical protein